MLNTIPFFKTDSGQRTFYYRIVSFWNSMESCLLKLSSQYSFKFNLKHDFIKDFID